jgi:hypothetical protein
MSLWLGKLRTRDLVLGPAIDEEQPRQPTLDHVID